jgi:peptidoglycan/LPS O-acetylase OafA/YrhL
MGSKRKISPFVRAISGLLGVASFAAVAYNASKAGGIEPDSGFFVSMLGGVIFLYAAFFGSIPWDVSSTSDGDKAKMTKGKWQMFWGAFVVFLVVMTSSLSEKGVFAEADLVVLGIVGFIFCIVGVALYLFVKGRSDDLG